ncbi:helix-turn-helix domain-containing protein [Rubrivirga sp.]|uniref:helix-turn-helix domain-containing protein n=1 Tax=Rubrivirga sp. TaxID=1885344 RepID=UPI003C7478C6
MPTPDDRALLDRLAHIGTVLAGTDPVMLGGRLRRVRLARGTSIRDLADEAGISKNSVVRLEQGRGTNPTTILRVCSALGLHLEPLIAGDVVEASVARVHHAKDDLWYDMTDFGAGPLEGADGPIDTHARQRAVASGEAVVPLNILKSRLPDGRVMPTILELYGPSELRTHPGEEFVYVIDGRVRVDVGPESYVLETGESLTFHSAEPHAYAPEADAVPSKLLSVRVEG